MKKLGQLIERLNILKDYTKVMLETQKGLLALAKRANLTGLDDYADSLIAEERAIELKTKNFKESFDHHQLAYDECLLDYQKKFGVKKQ